METKKEYKKQGINTMDVLYQNSNYSIETYLTKINTISLVIIKDENFSDYPVLNLNNNVLFDFPERYPKYIKEKIQKLFIRLNKKEIKESEKRIKNLRKQITELKKIYISSNDKTINYLCDCLETETKKITYLKNEK